MKNIRYSDLEPHGGVFLLVAGKEGPATLEYEGRSLIRYMDRIYLPSKPSLLDERTVSDLAELRLLLGPEVIDSRYTQGVLSYLYRRAVGKRGGMRILDFGCGDGNIAAFILTLPKSQRPREVIGVDICPLAIKMSEERLSSNRLGTAVMVKRDEKMPLEEGYFDAAIANFVMHFPITLAQANDMFRLLTPGGKLVYNNYQFLRDPGHDDALAGTFQRAGFHVRRERKLFRRFGAQALEQMEQRIVELSKAE